MELILLLCGRGKNTTTLASTCIDFSLPDLITQAFLHPLRIYLRTQNITPQLPWCTTIAFFHVPLNFLLVLYVNMGFWGVSLAAVCKNFNMVLALICYLYLSAAYNKSWKMSSKECLKVWRSLLRFSLPIYAFVCLGWWWYAIMI